MARDQPEMGYFLKDGNVSHGIVGLCDGEPISKEEAIAICKGKRDAEPKPETPEPAQTGGDFSAIETRVKTLELIIDKLGVG